MCKHAYRLLIRKTYVQNIIAVALSLCSFTYGAHLGVLIKACKVSILKLHICRYVNRKFFIQRKLNDNSLFWEIQRRMKYLRTVNPHLLLQVDKNNLKSQNKYWSGTNFTLLQKPKQI